MASLFYLPKAIPLSGGVVLAGARLHFTQTGTSTPQNTYQDSALTTAHANPVVADAGGIFPQIFLDPALPEYRVRLTNSAGVDIYQVDNYPSNTGGGGNSLRLTGAAPEIFFSETGVSANAGKWRVRIDAEQILISLVNDAENTFTTVATVDRGAGIAADSIVLGDSSWRVDLGGVVSVTGGTMLLNGSIVATTESGSYTGTLTGLTTSPTTTVTYRRAGALVTLSWSAQQGTSNTTALTMTGMPAAIRPGVVRQGITLSVQDNGSIQSGQVAAETSGDLTFSVGFASGTFTASGTKGVRASTITYAI